MTKKEKGWRISSFVIFLSFFHPSLTGCKWIFCSCCVSLGKSAGCVFRWLVIIDRVCARLLHRNHVRPRGNRRPLSFQVRIPPGVSLGKNGPNAVHPQGSNETGWASSLVTCQALAASFLQPSWLPASVHSQTRCVNLVEREDTANPRIFYILLVHPLHF